TPVLYRPRHPLAVRTDGQIANVAVRDRVGPEEAARRRVPDAEQVIPAVRADQPGAVGAIGQGPDVAAVGQGRARLACGRIPKADLILFIPASRGDPAAVGAEGHRVDVTGVAA